MRKTLENSLNVPLWERKIFFSSVGTFAMTVIAPFGTAEKMIMPVRFIFWGTVMILLGLLMHVIAVTGLRTAYLGNLSRGLRLMIAALLGAFPGTVVVIFVLVILSPPIVSPESYPMIYAQVAFVSLVMIMLEYYVPYTPWVPDRSEPEASMPTRNAEEPELPSFFRRLRPDLGTDIISLSMQDHYVEVTTNLGTQMILMRMSDAVGELGSYDGLQLHRSHWAAVEHMESLTRRKNKTLLLLSDGRELPVSNTYLRAVRDQLPGQ